MCFCLEKDVSGLKFQVAGQTHLAGWAIFRASPGAPQPMKRWIENKPLNYDELRRLTSP
jgi:hypothetical protein